MTDQKESLIDKAQINNLKQLFQQGFSAFIGTYFEDCELKEKELCLALKEKQFDRIIKIAHSLKGSSLNIGALGMANACYQIEMASKRQNIEELNTEYNTLKKIYPKTKEAFLEFT